MVLTVAQRLSSTFSEYAALPSPSCCGEVKSSVIGELNWQHHFWLHVLAYRMSYPVQVPSPSSKGSSSHRNRHKSHVTTRLGTAWAGRNLNQNSPSIFLRSSSVGSYVADKFEAMAVSAVFKQIAPEYTSAWRLITPRFSRGEPSIRSGALPWFPRLGMPPLRSMQLSLGLLVTRTGIVAIGRYSELAVPAISAVPIRI